MSRYLPELSDTDWTMPSAPKSSSEMDELRRRLYCAREWQPQFFLHARDVLSRNGLLERQIVPSEPLGARKDDGAPESLPSDNAKPTEFEAFLDVIRMAPLLLQAPDQVRSTLPGAHVPSAEVLRKVREDVGLDRTCTRASPSPHVYLLRTTSPEVRVISDIGDSLTLREMLLEYVAIMGRVVAQAASGRPPGDAKDVVNVQAFALLVTLNAELTVLERIREARGDRTPLRDLDVFYLRNPVGGNGSQSQERRGAMYISRSLGRSSIHDTLSEQGLTFPRQREAFIREFLGLVSAQLLHEVCHYALDRLGSERSFLLLEGEATFFGELFKQFFESGASPLADGTSLDTAADIEGFRPAEDRPESWTSQLIWLLRPDLPLTPTQRDLVCALRRAIADRGKLPIRYLLNTSPSLVETFDEETKRRSYAVAWATFVVLHRDHPDWLSGLYQMIDGLARDEPITREQSIILEQLSEEVTKWVGEAEAVCRVEESTGPPSRR